MTVGADQLALGDFLLNFINCAAVAHHVRYGVDFAVPWQVVEMKQRTWSARVEPSLATRALANLDFAGVTQFAERKCVWAQHSSERRAGFVASSPAVQTRHDVFGILQRAGNLDS